MRCCAWGWGLLAIGAGAERISDDTLLGVLCLLLGFLMLPFTYDRIRRSFGFRIAHPAAIAVAILAVMGGLGNTLQKRDQAEQQRLAIIARQERVHDDVLIARYPFVDRDSLHAWRTTAADSAIDPRRTFASFLEAQRIFQRKRISDSIESARKRREDSLAQALQWRQDSIASAKKWRQDSILAAKQRKKDSIDEARERRQLADLERRRERSYRTQSSAETYNGHIIYTGPRGGRYYINSNGNKTYIR